MMTARNENVVFAGENHMITLFADEAISVSMSCWRCTFSDAGEGTVLVVRNEAGLSGLRDLPARAVYSDNAALAALVVARFNQYFDGFRDQDYDRLVPQPARFAGVADGRRGQRVACRAEGITIELVWREMLDAALEIFDNTSGPVAYDVSAVICHCAGGEVRVNGMPAAGEPKRDPDSTYSSAFLAFSETWAVAAAQAIAGV
jgi:hypothetical protein